MSVRRTTAPIKQENKHGGKHRLAEKMGQMLCLHCHLVAIYIYIHIPLRKNWRIKNAASPTDLLCSDPLSISHNVSPCHSKTKTDKEKRVCLKKKTDQMVRSVWSREYFRAKEGNKRP